MSNSRRHRRRIRNATQMDPTYARLAIELSAAMKGCTCKPDIVHRGNEVDIKHDDWCPAKDAGDVFIIGPRRKRHGE